MDNTYKTETIGRFKIDYYYDEACNNPNDWRAESEGQLYGFNNRYYWLPGKYENLLDLFTSLDDNQTLYPVNYSVHSDIAFRSLGDGKTVKEIKRAFIDFELETESQNWITEKMQDYNLTQEEAEQDYLDHYLDSSELENMINSDIVVVAPSQEEARYIYEDFDSYNDGATGFAITNTENDEVVESIGGYYGNHEDMEAEARAMAETLEKDATKEDKRIKKEATESKTITMNTTLADMLTSENKQVKRLAKGIYKEIN